MFISKGSCGYGESKNVFLWSVQKPDLPVRACNLPHFVRWYRVENGNFRKFWHTFTIVPCLHKSNVYIKRKLLVWRVQKMYSSSQCKKPHLPVRACNLPSLMWGSIGPRTEFSGSSDLPFTVVPCLHQSNVYIKRKLRVWRVQKCIPLVGAKTALTCAGLKTTPSDVRW